ncbi:hypothetical protein PI125_g22903 [Phytophthora idaei]|nr:hypothetical protein PI125_g22903 [Phytophthora idaei]
MVRDKFVEKKGSAVFWRKFRVVRASGAREDAGKSEPSKRCLRLHGRKWPPARLTRRRARPAQTTPGGLGALQSIVQRATSGTCRGRRGGRTSRESGQGRSQSLPRASVSSTTAGSSATGLGGSNPTAPLVIPSSSVQTVSVSLQTT